MNTASMATRAAAAAAATALLAACVDERAGSGAPADTTAHTGEAPSAAQTAAGDEAPVSLDLPVTLEATAGDGLIVYGERYFGDLDASAPLVLLFHQGGSNGRAEYAPLTDWLNAAGYRAIAWDQRTGGDLYGASNRTRAGLPAGSDPGYCDAYQDLQAALDFVVKHGLAERVIVWGSSYSGALVFRLAAQNPEAVSRVLAFSPATGGSMAPCKASVWIDELPVPALAMSPGSEMSRESTIEQKAILEGAGVTYHVVEDGVHGSSMLVDARTERDMSAARARVLDWLGR